MDEKELQKNVYDLGKGQQNGRCALKGANLSLSAQK